jgi:hypothetical protein
MLNITSFGASFPSTDFGYIISAEYLVVVFVTLSLSLSLSLFKVLLFTNISCTGHWPSEEVLAYFCLSHAEMFRFVKMIIFWSFGFSSNGTCMT